MMKCSANTPAYSGRSAGRTSISASAESSRDSAPPVVAGSTGTARCSSARPASASAIMTRKMPGTPIAAVQHRCQYQGQHERHADADADERHRPGANLGSREVGQQRRDRRGHRSGALHATGDDQPGDAVDEHADQRAGREQQQAGRDDPLATVTVRPAPELDLQQRLRQSVGAHGQAEHFRGIVGEFSRIEREHREQQEQPQHAGRVDGRKRADRAALDRRERRPG